MNEKTTYTVDTVAEAAEHIAELYKRCDDLLELAEAQASMYRKLVQRVHELEQENLPGRRLMH